MRFSVVIPTYDRCEKLTACLLALFDQDYDKSQFEIIVVDDGSTDSTKESLQRFSKTAPVSLSFFSQPNSGQGVARNRGVAEARGEIILFLGDDMVATRELLTEHDRVHQLHPEENGAVLGFITWHPKLPVNAVMRFMEQGGAILGRFGGHQFAFDLLKGKDFADYRFFYTSNISLKRNLLLRFKFDPWFSGYGWEDIELGYRLEKQAGLKLSYAPKAVAYHDHMMDETQMSARMRAIGRSSHRIHAKYPQLGRIPSPQKKFLLRLLSHPVSLTFARALSENLYFYCLSKKYFLEGIEEGYNAKRV